MSNIDIVIEARSWVGVKWVHQGRTRNGIDCAGLVVEVARARRGNCFDSTDYRAQASDETMQRLCEQHMEPIDRATIEPGDVVVIRYQQQRHMAIVGDYPAEGHLSLIHASSIFGRVVEQRLDPALRRIVMSAYRMRGAA